MCCRTTEACLGQTGLTDRHAVAGHDRVVRGEGAHGLHHRVEVCKEVLAEVFGWHVGLQVSIITISRCLYTKENK